MGNTAAAAKCGTARPWRWLIMVLLVLLIGLEFSRAWIGWQRNMGQFGEFARLADGTLCAVTLTTGQVYYGTLAAGKNSYFRLDNVYYVQNIPQANGGATQFRLVSREKTDWHSPQWMVIPTDKILYIENVGPQSRLATLIAQDRTAAQGGSH